MKPSNIQGGQWLQGREDYPHIALADTLILFQSGEGGGGRLCPPPHSPH